MLRFFILGFWMFTPIVHATGDTPKLDMPIIQPDLLKQFDKQRPIRVDVSVCDAGGKGEKALDFFVVEAADREIPNTLKGIFEKSPFIRSMISTFFEAGSETLMVTEMISAFGEKEKVKDFIGVRRADLDMARP